MCAPMALAIMSFAISAASGIAGYMGQQQQYQAQVDQYNRNADNAEKAAGIRYDQLNLKMIQEGEATAEKKFQSRLAAKRAAATGRTAAGEGGVAGLSVAALVGDIYGQSGRYDASVDRNLQINRSYLEGEKDATQAQGQNQINSVPIPTAPNFAATLIGIFGSGIDAASDYKQAL